MYLKTSGFFLSFIFILNTVFAYAQLDKLLPADLETRLMREKILSSAHFENMNSELSPKYEPLLKAIDALKKELNPSVMVESICFYKKPDDCIRLWTDKEKTILFNGILSISTLTGLTYYSGSRKQTRLFYESSFAIDSYEKQNKLKDPVFTSKNLPSFLTIYAKQKDLTFGENIYKLEFTLKNDAIMFKQLNLTTMYYGIIPVLGKKNLNSLASVIDTNEYLLIYIISMADAISFPGMKNRVGASFAARSEALLKWFSEKASAAYASPENNKSDGK
jgi:hypothetical protein